MKKTAVTVGLVAVMVLSAVYVSAQGPGFGPGPGAGPRWGRGEGRPCGPWEQVKALNLTPEQKAKLDELRAKFREENAQLIGTMVTKRIELQSLWSNPKADDKAILDKSREMRDLRNQMMDKAVQMRLEARKILTPEQIAQMPHGRGFGPGFGGELGPGAGRGMGGFGRGCGGSCGHGWGGSY